MYYAYFFSLVSTESSLMQAIRITMTTKMPAMPFHMISKEATNAAFIIVICSFPDYRY